MRGQPKRVELVPAKRQALILECLRAHGPASIQQLAQVIGGSQSTVRRDLEHLTEAGYLERTHGGALLIPPARAAFEGEFPLQQAMCRAQKQAIGLAAAGRLSARQSVIFDSSSTVLEAVRVLARQPLPLTVVTNSLEIALVGAGVPSWRTIVPGGTVRPGSTMLAGAPGEDFFAGVHADVFLVGALAVTGTLLTDATIEVASLKRAMMRSAQRRILLVDSSKFRPPCFSAFGDLAEIDEVITDDGIAPEHVDALGAADVKVMVVPVAKEDGQLAV
jgi:DeoR/GlpR family transcriptional regulator of sugar metabolism